MHTKDTQVEFFFDSADLYSTSKLYISLSDVNFNEGRPRDREVISKYVSVHYHLSFNRDCRNVVQLSLNFCHKQRFIKDLL